MSLQRITSCCLSPFSKGQSMDIASGIFLVLVLFCATTPLELPQLASVFVGAIAYALIQATKLSTMRIAPRKSIGKVVADSHPSPRTQLHKKGGLDAKISTLAASRRFGNTKSPCEFVAPSKLECRQPSAQPLTPLTLSATTWEAEVEEMMGQIRPTVETDIVVARLTNVVKQILRRTVPDVEVHGFANGDLVRGTANSVAVPEVDIVVNVPSNVLEARLHGRGGPVVKLDARKLQKSAIRTCTDRLVSGGLKFRRSAFRGLEPKVTLLVPASLGVHSEAIAIDLSVNSKTPVYSAGLLAECGKIDPRAKDLILLVKRWAKDRGICHIAKGYLSPYLWTLLSIYFLQVGVPEEGSLLPSVEGFEVFSCCVQQANSAAVGLHTGLPSKSGRRHMPEQRAAGFVARPVATLFADFMDFYAKVFDWRNEAVAVRLGKRAPPSLALPINILLQEGTAMTVVAPSIEDPFEPNHNLGQSTTASSLHRIWEEISRADELCRSGASLTEILKPWVPPARGDDGPMERVESAN